MLLRSTCSRKFKGKCLPIFKRDPNYANGSTCFNQIASCLCCSDILSLRGPITTAVVASNMTCLIINAIGARWCMYQAKAASQRGIHTIRSTIYGDGAMPNQSFNGV